MLMSLIVLMGLWTMVNSANTFVDQASALAKKLRVGDFLIGFTIVAFGTSLPEMISTIFAASSGHNQLVVSNIIGSNMANSCLVFGVIALFNNYRIRKRDIDINIPINMAALMAFWAVSVWAGFVINWSFGVSLILVFVVLVILSKEYDHFETVERKYVRFSVTRLLGSLTLLIISGKVLIDGIISLSVQFMVSETILGYFLLAVGTSLPEMVTTWVAVKKHEGELGVGNVLGSNLFNLLFILGISSFIQPVNVSGFRIDLVLLTGATLTVYIFAILGKKYAFSRREGLGMVLIYVVFVMFQLLKL